MINIDTIRRRAGLRPTLAVHRHAQPTRTSTNSKQQEKPSVTTSSVTSHRNSSLRQATMAAVSTTKTTIVPINIPAQAPSPSKKKVEKDILRHASRIRTSQLKDYFNRLDSSLKSYPSQNASSLSNSPTRMNHTTKRSKINKTPKSISLVSMNNCTQNKTEDEKQKKKNLEKKDNYLC